MVFNSYEFVFIFLPFSVAGYWLVKSFLKSTFLNSIYVIAVSLLFYFCSEVFHGVVFLGMMTCNWICYLLLSHSSSSVIRKFFLFAGIAGNMSWLIYYKYYNFFIDTINLIFKTDLQIKTSLLPLGISFISFSMIAFLIDGYRGEYKKIKFMDFATFATFFPKLVSGPFVQCKDMCDKSNKKDKWELLAEGLFLFVMGLGKKVLLADLLGNAVDYAYNNLDQMDTCTVLVVSLMYSFQIYFDFSGYSDMAIGIGRMFGYVLPINFNSPYKAVSIADFWDRWHMTLTRFLTNYLYIPLGGSRKGKIRTYINIMLVFLCSGFWHGASWTFVLWGAMHGVAMVVFRMFKKIFERIPQWLGALLTFLFVNATWLVFRSNSLGNLRMLIKALINWQGIMLNEAILECFNWGIFNVANIRVICLAICLLLCFCIVFVLPNTQEIVEHQGYLRKEMAVVSVLMAVVSIMLLSNVTNYIYAMF